MSSDKQTLEKILYTWLPAYVISQNEEEFVPKFAQNVNFNDLSKEDNYQDSTRQNYFKKPSQPSLKIARDSDGASFPGGFSPAIGSKGGGFGAGLSSFPAISGGIGVSGGHSFPTVGNLDHGIGGAGASFGHGGAVSGGGGYSFSGGGGGYSHGGGGGTSFGGGSSSFGHGGGHFGGSGSSLASFGGNSGGGYSYGGAGGGGGSSHGGDSGGGNQQTPVIHKSVYVHIAPPEDDVPRQKVIVPNVAPKKNYQIVFIKAPTQPPPSAPVIPPFPTQSDKTLIYVLHPKPEEAPPIHIPAPPQSVPIKPEVYFIRYKTKTAPVDEGGSSGGYGGGGSSDGYGGSSGGFGGSSGGFGGYHRRYGRDGSELEETLEVSDTENKSVAPEYELPTLEYEERQDHTDSSGEGSKIRLIYTTERGKNAH